MNRAKKRKSGAQRLVIGAWVVVWAGMFLVGVAPGQQASPAAAEGKSSPAALTAYADAVTYQNRMAFELAAEEWSRFLQRFADDPLAPKAMHYRGVCLVQLKQFAEAVNLFHDLIAKYPEFELLEEATLNLAWSQYSLGLAGDKNRYAQAVETFGKLEERFPQGKKVDQALFFKAESLYALEKKKDAAMAYGKLVTQHEQSPLRADALYALGVTLEELSEWKQAIKAYEMFVEGYAQDELVDEVRMRLAESILQDGDAAAAEALFAKVVAVPGFAAADYALLRQAYCLESQGKDLDAARLYAQLVERFPKSQRVGESTLLAARCFYRAGQLTEAAQWFDKALAQPGAGRAEAAHWRCRIHLQENQPAAALELAARVLADTQDDPFLPELRLDKADALYQLPDRRPEALQEYVAIAEAHPQHRVGPIALYDGAFAALEAKDYQQATELAGRFLAGFPQHELTPDVRYIVAECKIQAKAYEEAEAIYRQILDSTKTHPELPVWRVRLGLVLHLQKKYQEAVDLLTPLIAELKDPGDRAEALYLVGISKFELQDYESAIDTLRQSLLADANWRQADETLLYLARAQRQRNQLPEVVATLEELLKNYPASALLDQAHYHLAEAYYAGQQYPQAIAAYERVPQLNAQSVFLPLALYGKGWSQLKSQQYEPAVATFTALIEQHPDSGLTDESMFARGMSLRQAKQYAAAIADLDKYLASHPAPEQQASALYERGLAEASSEQHAQAVATFNQLLKDCPDYAHADKVLYELAWSCRSLQDAAGATQAFSRLAREHAASPLAAEALFHVGENAYVAKDYAAASASYEAAAGSATGALRVKALYKLGWSEYLLQKYDRAHEHFAALLQADAEGELASDAWFMKGECRFRAERYEDAWKAYQEAIRREPSSPLIAVLCRLHAGQAAGQLSKWQESIQLLDPLIAEHPDSAYLAEAYFERGQARLKLQQLDEALQDFQAAADNSRGVVGVRALVMRGEIAFQQKRFEEAIKDFQRAMFRTVPQDAPAQLHDWQAKAGFEAGRCAEAQIAGATTAADRARHIADAKKFYQYVVETHAQHDLAKSAQQRLAEVGRLVP